MNKGTVTQLAAGIIVGLILAYGYHTFIAKK
jgi:hypothetical protein